jgi:hypothetical protein
MNTFWRALSKVLPWDDSLSPCVRSERIVWLAQRLLIIIPSITRPIIVRRLLAILPLSHSTQPLSHLSLFSHSIFHCTLTPFILRWAPPMTLYEMLVSLTSYICATGAYLSNNFNNIFWDHLTPLTIYTLDIAASNIAFSYYPWAVFIWGEGNYIIFRVSLADNFENIYKFVRRVALLIRVYLFKKFIS